MAKRTLERFIEGLSALQAARIAVRVGEQRNPASVGEVDLSLFAMAGTDGLDVARLATHLRERVESAGYPDDWPSFKLEAYAADRKAAVDTYQQTDRAAADERPDASRAAPLSDFASIVNRLCTSNERLTETLRANARDIADAFKSEREAGTLAMREAAEARAREAELESAMTLMEQAVEDAGEGADVILKSRALDVLERVGETWIKSGGLSEKGLRRLMDKHPEKAKKLLKAMASDEKARALFMEALAPSTDGA